MLQSPEALFDEQFDRSEEDKPASTRAFENGVMTINAVSKLTAAQIYGDGNEDTSRV